jgi:transposase
MERGVRPLRYRRERLRKERKNYTAEEKVAILKRHLVDKEPISKLCDEMALQPTVFYPWQKEFFENGATAFQAKARSHHQAEQERIEYLEKKIQTKDEVLAELMAEHVALKKVVYETTSLYSECGGARWTGPTIPDITSTPAPPSTN